MRLVQGRDGGDERVGVLRALVSPAFLIQMTCVSCCRDPAAAVLVTSGMQPNSLQTVFKRQMFADSENKNVLVGRVRQLPGGSPRGVLAGLLSATNVATIQVSTYIVFIELLSMCKAQLETTSVCSCDFKLSGEPCLGLVGQLCVQL